MGNIINLLFDDPGVEQTPIQRRTDMSSFILALLVAFGSSFVLSLGGVIIIGVAVYAGLRFLQRGGY